MAPLGIFAVFKLVMHVGVVLEHIGGLGAL